MRTYTKTNLWHKSGTVFVLSSLEDFDEYEKYLNSKDLLKYNPNFYSFKEDFKQFIGKIWVDDNCENEYKIVAIEDSNPDCDWYWVAQNIDDDRDIKYLLCNNNDFKNHIKNEHI